MAALRSALFGLPKGYGFQNLPSAFLVLSPAVVGRGCRLAHSQALNKNLQYISNEKIKLNADPKTLKLDKQPNKPLCIIMNWMLARPEHVMKYASLYLEQGFDVVSVSCSPWQLMWPLKGSQLVGADLIRFMSSNDHGPMVLHGFSVGAYVWAEALVFALKEKEKYQPVLERVVAQVWDSAADITEIPVGFPSAVFPKNMFLQNALRTYTKYHLKKFHDAATSHYLRASELFHVSPCRAPALFLLSRSDPVGAERSNRSVHDSWVNIGIKCTWHCWDRSPHVLHYNKHPKEYLQLLYTHLETHGLLTQPEKLRARMTR
ncbi:hypothetical protein ABMA28_003458 [Loxostege sticticalis]|uniref:Transmembrane protein 53 n=1 Tax=Loxostege sticticalis TaxID=481309 RepID=A0ABD0SWD8_LOXSC